jgi:hypothetical protein
MTAAGIVLKVITETHAEHHRVNVTYPDDLETKAYKEGLYFAEKALLDAYEKDSEASAL